MYVITTFSAHNFYLVMEDGGHSLFAFVQKAHSLIQAGNLEISHWNEVCKVIFKQMVECVEYLHSQGICHMDISLENVCLFVHPLCMFIIYCFLVFVYSF